MIIDVNKIDNFIVANDAYKESAEKAKLEQQIYEEINSIFSEIRIAILDGKFSIKYKLYHDPYDIKNFLEKYGYTVTIEDGFVDQSESILTIKWEKIE